MSFGLSEKTMALLKSVFKKYPAISQVKIYGSRAVGDYERGSDIDLVFFFDTKEDLSSRLSRDLDELPTPYLFDVVNYDQLEAGYLKREIDQKARVLYKKEDRGHSDER